MNIIKYFTIRGRLSKNEFTKFLKSILVFIFLCTFIGFIFAFSNFSSLDHNHYIFYASSLFGFVISNLLLCFSLMRRWHDMGKSGTIVAVVYFVSFFIPFAHLAALLYFLIVAIFKDGEISVNNYGDEGTAKETVGGVVLSRKNDFIVIGFIFALLLMLSIVMLIFLAGAISGR